MTAKDLEEVHFFYCLHSYEFQKGMAAARNSDTKEYRACCERMRLLALRLLRAKAGYYKKGIKH